MWRRLAERIVPRAALDGVGLVGWRIVDPAPAGVAGLGFAIPVSRQLLNDASPFDWYGPRWHWKQWPIGSMWDLIPPNG